VCLLCVAVCAVYVVFFFAAVSTWEMKVQKLDDNLFCEKLKRSEKRSGCDPSI
jgi:hypothetical protein